MSVKERLIEFIKYKNLSHSRFEKDVGLSNGYVNNIRKSISDNVLQKIALTYQDLNATWLRMGEGKMLKEVQPDEDRYRLCIEDDDDDSLEDYTKPCKECIKKDQLIKELREQLKEKDLRIDNLNEIIKQQIKEWGAATSAWRVPDDKKDTG